MDSGKNFRVEGDRKVSDDGWTSDLQGKFAVSPLTPRLNSRMDGSRFARTLFISAPFGTEVRVFIQDRTTSNKKAEMLNFEREHGMFPESYDEDPFPLGIEIYEEPSPNPLGFRNCTLQAITRKFTANQEILDSGKRPTADNVTFVPFRPRRKAILGASMSGVKLIPPVSEPAPKHKIGVYIPQYLQQYNIEVRSKDDQSDANEDKEIVYIYLPATQSHVFEDLPSTDVIRIAQTSRALPEAYIPSSMFGIRYSPEGLFLHLQYDTVKYRVNPSLIDD